MEKAIAIILILGVIGIAHGMVYPGVVTMTADRKPPTRCVAPSRFEFTLIEALPAPRGTNLIFGNVSYDAIQQRIRVFQTLIGSTPQTAHDIRFFYKQGYMYDVDLVKRRCYKSSIPKTFPTYHVPKNAPYVGSLYFGLSFWINQWSVKMGQSGSQAFMAWTADGKCIPVSQTVVGPNVHMATASFVNTTLGIRDQHVFDIPKICRRTVQPKAYEDSFVGRVFGRFMV